MSTYRTRHNKDNPYVMLSKGFLEDPNLSAKAKGILAYLLSRPDNWQTHTDHLIKVMKDGRDSILSGLRELEKTGYFIRYPVRDPKTKQVTHWIKDVFETPQPRENKATNGKAVDGKAVKGNPSDGMPDDGNPSDGKPCEEMTVGLISNEEVNTEKINIELNNNESIPPTPPEGGGACEKKADSLRLEKEVEAVAVAVEVEIVTETEEEIQNKIHPLVESEKQTIQTSNSNSGEELFSALACDNNTRLSKTTRRRKVKPPQISPEQQQAFLDAYLAEKPSNFVKHSKLLKGDIESIDKLVQEHGDKAFEMFVFALVWIREREDGLWYKSKSHSLKGVFTNDKVPRYFDEHCHAMENDPEYRARVEGRAPSKDKSRVSPAVKERQEQRDQDFMDMIMSAKI